MKKLALITLLVVAFGAAGSAEAQRPVKIYAGGGIGFPLSPDGFKDGYKMGFHGKLAAGLSLPSMPGLELMGKFEYHMFDLDADTLDGGELTFLMFGVDGKYGFGAPAAPAKPYALAGLGLANWEQKDSGMDSQSDIYVNFGAGVDIKAGTAFGIFAELRYVIVMAEEESLNFLPFTVGFKF